MMLFAQALRGGFTKLQRYFSLSLTSSALYRCATLLFLTAIAIALRDPTMTASFFARVTAV
jgi:hypothetical protein